jgi:hypothetical protein
MALRFRGLDAPIEIQYWKGGSPPVPDPNVQIAAQKSADQYNVVGPGGTTKWTQGPQMVTGYDQNGKPIYGTQSTQTTTLSADQQKQYDLSNQISQQLLGGANKNIGTFVNDPYTGGKAFDYNSETPDAAKAAYSAQAALLQPSFDKSNRQFDDKMANAGIPVGSEAYNDAKRQQDNDQNFALTDAAARAQGTGANMAFQQNQANNAQALQTRQQQYNEIAAALGGNQLAPVGQFAGGGGGSVDASGAFNAQNNAKLAGYNAGVAGDNSALNAGAGLAGAGITAGIIVF